MLDVHPPHEAAHSWKDFFIHIATIVIGLLIAIGLEQTVEAIHHHHQVADLTEQMRVEAEHNLTINDGTLAALQPQIQSFIAVQAALAAGAFHAGAVTVAPVPRPAFTSLIISPSRGTWVTAQSAGLVALLPAEQAKLYARLDFNAEEQVRAEDTMLQQRALFLSECARSGYDTSSDVPSSLTPAHLGDLLFRIDQLNESMRNLAIRLVIMRGADHAIADRVSTLDQMYAYQTKQLAKLKASGSLGRFY